MSNTQETIQQDCAIAGRPELAASFLARGLTAAQARAELLAEVAAAKPGGLAANMRETLRARGLVPADEQGNSTQGHRHHSTAGGGPRPVRQVDSMRAYLKSRGITPADETQRP